MSEAFHVDGTYVRPTPHKCPTCKNTLYVRHLNESNKMVLLFCNFGCFEQSLVPRPKHLERAQRLPREAHADQQQYHEWFWLEVKCPECKGPIEARQKWSRKLKYQLRCVACNWEGTMEPKV